MIMVISALIKPLKTDQSQRFSEPFFSTVKTLKQGSSKNGKRFEVTFEIKMLQIFTKHHLGPFFVNRGSN